MKLLDAATRRILDRIKIAIRSTATASRQGGHRSRALASGIEFADHRPYVPGDDVRHIDWKAFARHGQLTLRQFEEERDARIYILLDLSGSMQRGEPSKVEAAKRIAASFAYVGMRQFDRAMILPFGDTLTDEALVVRGAKDVPSLDRFIEGCEAGGSTSLEAAVRALAARHPRRAMVVVISDLMKPDGFPEAFAALGALGHELRVVHLASEGDLNPSLGGELELVDSEDQRTVRLRVSKELLESYCATMQEHLERCRSAARRAGGNFVSIDTALAPETMVRRALAEDGRRSK